MTVLRHCKPLLQARYCLPTSVLPTSANTRKWWSLTKRRVAEAQACTAANLPPGNTNSRLPGSATAVAEYFAALAAILDSFGGPITTAGWDKLATTCPAVNPADIEIAPRHAAAYDPMSSHTRFQSSRTHNQLQSTTDTCRSADHSVPTFGFLPPCSTVSGPPAVTALPVFDAPLSRRLPRDLPVWSLEDSQLSSLPTSTPQYSCPAATYTPSAPLQLESDPSLPVFDMPLTSRLPSGLPIWRLDNIPVPLTTLADPHPPDTAVMPDPSDPSIPSLSASSGALPVFDMPLSCRIPAGLPIWSLDTIPFPATPSSAAHLPYTAGVTPHHSCPVSPQLQSRGMASAEPLAWQPDASLPLLSQSIIPSMLDLQWESAGQHIALFKPAAPAPVPPPQYELQLADGPGGHNEPISSPVSKKKRGEITKAIGHLAEPVLVLCFG